MAENKNSHLDQDIHKGAVEDDTPQPSEHNTSLRGQQGHRNMPEMAEGTDTDYPEPGQNPEHTGEKTDTGPGKKTGATNSEQKTNQNQRKDDLLAS